MTPEQRSMLAAMQAQRRAQLGQSWNAGVGQVQTGLGGVSDMLVQMDARRVAIEELQRRRASDELAVKLAAEERQRALAAQQLAEADARARLEISQRNQQMDRLGALSMGVQMPGGDLPGDPLARLQEEREAMSAQLGALTGQGQVPGMAVPRPALVMSPRSVFIEQARGVAPDLTEQEMGAAFDARIQAMQAARGAEELRERGVAARETQANRPRPGPRPTGPKVMLQDLDAAQALAKEKMNQANADLRALEARGLRIGALKATGGYARGMAMTPQAAAELDQLLAADKLAAKAALGAREEAESEWRAVIAEKKARAGATGGVVQPVAAQKMLTEEQAARVFEEADASNITPEAARKKLGF